MGLSMLSQTIRNTFRSWRCTPVLAVSALLTLSLGVGVNAAVFSVVHAVLFRPLPYPASERLVELFEVEPARGALRASVLNYASWAERTNTLEALAAFNSVSFNVAGESQAERVNGAVVTASLFRVLAVAPLAGRPLRSDDERPGSRRVAVIAQSFWQRRYGADPSLIGRTVPLSGELYEIVGVVPDTFRDVGRSRVSSVASPQIFVPLTIDAARENRGNRVMRVVGRLRPGVSIEQTRDEMRGIAAALGSEFPVSNSGWSVRVDSVYDSMLDQGVRPALLALLGAVVLVMLIACANVSNLVFAKAIGRQRELALRTALGADPGRLVRQLVGESLCLAAVSGAIGVAISMFAVEVLRSWLPPAMPRTDEVRVDMVVLGFGLVVSLVSGILFGTLPAIRVSRMDPLQALTGSARGVTTRSSRALRQTMVAAQVALATTLLVGTVLLLQSFIRLQQVPLGFEPGGVLTARVGLPRAAYPAPPRIRDFYQRLLLSLDANAEIQSAAVATSAPFTSGVRRSAKVGERTTAANVSSVSVAEHIVSESYFHTLSIPILIGRAFDERDAAASPSVVIVNQAAARQLWPRGNAVGQQIEIDGRLHEIIGISGDVRGDDVRGATGGGPDRESPAAIYLSATQFPQSTMTVLIRVYGPSERTGPTNDNAVVSALRAAIRAIDPGVPADQVRSLDDWLLEATAQPRLTTMLAAAFAAMAMFLAAIGIYAVAAYGVGQRRQEIGLRIAVGATPAHVVAMILRSGVTSAGVGMLIGFAGALAVNRLLAGLLFQVRPEDPIAFASVSAILGIVALVACYLPARRAASVDPLITLRSQ
jgi:putative ABC transport system permease protein